MNSDDKGTFSVEDIRALRYLAIVLGLVGMGLIWKLGPDEPLAVSGFLAIVMLAVVATNYGLRCLPKKTKPNKASEPVVQSDRDSS